VVVEEEVTERQTVECVVVSEVAETGVLYFDYDQRRDRRD
jgi:hypothetical protein